MPTKKKAVKKVVKEVVKEPTAYELKVARQKKAALAHVKKRERVHAGLENANA